MVAEPGSDSSVGATWGDPPGGGGNRGTKKISAAWEQDRKDQTNESQHPRPDFSLRRNRTTVATINATAAAAVA